MNQLTVRVEASGKPTKAYAFVAAEPAYPRERRVSSRALGAAIEQ